MASQKISQLTAITTVASGDYFPIVRASDVTNRRVEVGVLDARYTLAASGVAAQSTANTALSSGIAAQSTANTALSSGIAAQSTANTALASGNAGLSAVGSRYAISGGLIDGQVRSVITALGLNGSGIPCTSGNFFTAILSGNSSVYFTGVPAASYSLAYEVRHDTGTITWPTSVTWPSATAPTLTTGKTHLFMFVTDDSGTTWRASSLINYTT
jgi:hypothetical protein